mmetsp:Transcript_3406/g.10341  ORF Transcript_3406/g.10341 Transcript_3406/m.10341 type:complete len:224 (-) Transcript_3406:501-1172(-)
MASTCLWSFARRIFSSENSTPRKKNQISSVRIQPLFLPRFDQLAFICITASPNFSLLSERIVLSSCAPRPLRSSSTRGVAVSRLLSADLFSAAFKSCTSLFAGLAAAGLAGLETPLPDATEGFMSRLGVFFFFFFLSSTSNEFPVTSSTYSRPGIAAFASPACSATTLDTLFRLTLTLPVPPPGDSFNSAPLASEANISVTSPSLLFRSTEFTWPLDSASRPP